MRCPVFREQALGYVLRLCYAMPGAEMAYARTGARSRGVSARGKHTRDQAGRAGGGEEEERERGARERER
eukprot:2251162-Rhodomonas_salina.1